MNQIDKTQNPVLTDGKSIEFTFSSLGIWRKIFLVVNWIVSIFLVAVLLFFTFSENKQIDVNLAVVVFAILCLLGYSYWLHVAVSKRKVGHLAILLITQIVPFGNPIGALMLFAIRSTSKSELKVDGN